MTYEDKEKALLTYQPLFYKLAQKFVIPNYELEDKMQVLRMNTWKLLDKYDDSRGVKLLSYLYTYNEFMLRKLRTKELKNRHIIVYLDRNTDYFNSAIYRIDGEVNFNAPSDEDVIKEAFMKGLELLPKCDVSFDIFAGVHPKVIAKQKGVSRQYIDQVHKTNCNTVLKDLRWKGYDVKLLKDEKTSSPMFYKVTSVKNSCELDTIEFKESFLKYLKPLDYKKVVKRYIEGETQVSVSRNLSIPKATVATYVRNISNSVLERMGYGKDARNKLKKKYGGK